MKYYLEIDGTEFSNCSDLKISGGYRKESVQESIGGDLLIDRIGGEKLTISAKINLVTHEEMQTILAAKAKIFVDIAFYRGKVWEKHTMHILDFTEPSPIYYYGDLNEGMVYGTVTIKAEEK